MITLILLKLLLSHICILEMHPFLEVVENEIKPHYLDVINWDSEIAGLKMKWGDFTFSEDKAYQANEHAVQCLTRSREIVLKHINNRHI